MASCPNCGFDLSADGTCSVCGYGREQPAGAVVPSPRQRRLPLLIGAAALCVLVAGAAVFFGIRAGEHAATAGTPTSVAAVRASVAVPRTQGSPTKRHGTANPQPASETRNAERSMPAPPATKSVSYNPAKYEDNPLYRVAVGASPVSLRATKPVNLYIPAHQPAYDIAKRAQFPPLTSESAFVSWMLAHTHQSKHFLEWRWQRAQIIMARHLITHRRVLMAFLLTPREWFVRSYNLGKTYANTAIPIGFGQTISGPELVAHMTNSLDPQPNQRVLEIGTGSGYQSAVLSELSNYVYTIEIVKPLGEQTNAIYLSHTQAEPQYANIHRRLADGYYGWPRYAPFDRIIVTTGIDHIPPVLLKELKPGGVMVIPIGPPTGQVVLKVRKTVGKDGGVRLTRKEIYRGGHREIFVPFTASGGGTHNSGAASGKQ